MPLWTTYLTNWCINRVEILKFIGATSERHIAVPKFVMRNRGNNEVAPPKDLLKRWKNKEISWEQYTTEYLKQLDSVDACEWMADVAQDLQDGVHVILICFEKPPALCHRRLLASEIITDCQDLADEQPLPSNQELPYAWVKT